MTDELIARLSADLKPVPRSAMFRLVLGAVLVGAMISAIVMLGSIGPRGDIEAASGTMIFWTKFIYTLAFALLGAVAVLILTRPDGRTRWPWFVALGILVLLIIGAFVQLLRAAPADMMPLVFGASPMRCLTYAVAFSLPILAASLLAMRRLAPASPTLAGFAAGLMSGGTGAWIYAFACNEPGMMFLAIWYTLAIALVGLIGAVMGRLLLRW